MEYDTVEKNQQPPDSWELYYTLPNIRGQYCTVVLVLCPSLVNRHL